MKFAIIMNDNSYAGREYLKALNSKRTNIDIICIGNYPERNQAEDERCHKLWNPPRLEEVAENRNVYRFNSLNSDELLEFLKKKKYNIGIQGGTGILKENVIETFQSGILNFHPGDLPQYRGCSAPEWQLFEGKPIICTCHLIDSGIDTGKIYKKKELDVDKNDYYKMRSQIYVEISKFVCEVISEIKEDFVQMCTEQSDSEAIYREYIGREKIKILIEKMREKEL